MLKRSPTKHLTRWKKNSLSPTPKNLQRSKKSTLNSSVLFLLLLLLITIAPASPGNQSTSPPRTKRLPLNRPQQPSYRFVPKGLAQLASSLLASSPKPGPTQPGQLSTCPTQKYSGDWPLAVRKPGSMKMSSVNLAQIITYAIARSPCSLGEIRNVQEHWIFCLSHC